MAHRKVKAAASRKPWFAALAALTLFVALSSILLWRRPSLLFLSARGAPDVLSDPDHLARYAGSSRCQKCHVAEFDRWKNSHHALAQRPLDPRIDGVAFEPPQSIKHGTQESSTRVRDGRYEVVTLGLDAKVQPYKVEDVFGVHPLRQFLVAAPGGRFQVTEIAFDPVRKDWFDVFGNEDRRPGEWGHWTGRGMTWNYMCAACHNTGLRKNYRESTDSYATIRAEAGVGCESCHGPMKDHAEWQQKKSEPKSKDPTIHRLDRLQMLSLCGSCHSRRSELTGRFQPGDKYLDHYFPAIPDETDIYYPDGQVRDEDFEYVSFLGSRMHAAGVGCNDCHDMHSGKTRASDNSLCLRCHSGSTPNVARIDPASHTHHTPDQPGGRCVDCHMPLTTYMARHPRRDHGFTIPDPLLTEQHAIPNACNRCHEDRSAGWGLKSVQEWYGERLEKRTRERTQWIIKARAGDRSSIEHLVKMSAGEDIALWRAVTTGILRQWSSDPTVSAALVARTKDSDALVRGEVAHAFESSLPEEGTAVRGALKRLLDDPVRFVRIQAAWTLRETVDPASIAGKDLLHQLEYNQDQPTGALQLGYYRMSRGETDAALAYIRRAASWDPSSAALRDALAVALSSQGKTQDAVKELEEACRLEPRHPEYRFKLALALNEVGKLEQACLSLQEAVRLDPRFVRAWYNLGLAYSSLQQPEEALRALGRAEQLDSTSAMAPYSRATILLRLNRIDDARAAAERALAIDPGLREAAALLATLRSR